MKFLLIITVLLLHEILMSCVHAADMSPALQKIWGIYHQDVGGDDERRNQAERDLATRPEFKTDYFTMLQSEYFDAIKRGEKGDASAVGLISMRKDLTPAEVKMITDEMAKHVAPEDDSGFVTGGIRLLENHPSSEHEALVLRFLNRSAKQRHTLRVAFDTLSDIGSEKSLVAMREVFVRMKAENPQYSFLEDLNLHLSNLQYRLEHERKRAKP